MGTTTTLYGRLGGGDAIGKVTGSFYGAVLADPSLAPYFEGVDMERQQGMLAAFLVMVSGGPQAYAGRSLRDAHAGLGIGDEQFDAVLVHLIAALTSAGAAREDVAEVAAAAESLRPEVLGR